MGELAIQRRWLLRLGLLLPLLAGALRSREFRPCERERLASTRMEVYGTMDPAYKAAGLGAVYITHYSPYKARRQYMERQLDALGLQAHFVVGWDREALTDADVQCMYPSNAVFDKVAKRRQFAASWLTTGELGLAMKHHSAYSDMLAKGHRNILVLEDDAEFDKNFKTELPKILRNEDKSHGDYDVLFLGSYFRTKNWDETQPPRIKPDLGNKGAIGYLVSAKGAHWLVGHLPITGPADHLVSNADYPNAPPARYSRQPYLIWQGSLDGAWRESVTKTVLFKGRQFVMTSDITPCAGCGCPSKIQTVSKHVVEDMPPAAATFAEQADNSSAVTLDRSRSETRALDLDEDYIQAYMGAGGPCDPRNALEIERDRKQQR